MRKRSALFDLPPPGASEIADIVKGPARSAGLVFEERDGVPLSKVISAEVQRCRCAALVPDDAGAALRRAQGQTLTYDAYEAIGGLEGAIASHAETVFATVSPSGQETLDALLRMLVADIDQDGRLTVRTPDRAALIAAGATAELVDKMTEARLLVSADGTVRVAHEALLRRWQRATESPALQPEAIHLRRQIEPNFRIWNETRLDADLLQRGTTLAAAEDIVDKHPGAFPVELTDYIKRSAETSAARSRAEELRAEREARRARRQTCAVAIVALLLAALSVTIFRLYEHASRNFLLALLTRTDQYLIDGMPSHAFAMAGTLRESACSTGLWPLSACLIQRATRPYACAPSARSPKPASAVPLRTLVRESPANAAAFSADGSKFAIGYGDGSIMVGRADRAGKDTRLAGHTAGSGPCPSLRMAGHLASASTHEVLLWDLEQGEAQPLCGAGANFTDIAFDPQGRYLAWSSRDGLVTVRDMTTSQSQSFQGSNGGIGGRFQPRWRAFRLRRATMASSSSRRTDDWSLPEYDRDKGGRPDQHRLQRGRKEARGRKPERPGRCLDAARGWRREFADARPGASGKALEDQVFA